MLFYYNKTIFYKLTTHSVFAQPKCSLRHNLREADESNHQVFLRVVCNDSENEDIFKL